MAEDGRNIAEDEEELAKLREMLDYPDTKEVNKAFSDLISAFSKIPTDSVDMTSDGTLSLAEWKQITDFVNNNVYGEAK